MCSFFSALSKILKETNEPDNCCFGELLPNIENTALTLTPIIAEAKLPFELLARFIADCPTTI